MAGGGKESGLGEIGLLGLPPGGLQSLRACLRSVMSSSASRIFRVANGSS
jgi:hypothetical protein